MAVEADMSEVVTMLCSHTRLERERALSLFEVRLKDSKGFPATDGKVVSLHEALLSLLDPATGEVWERKLGGLTGCKLVVTSGLGSDSFCESARRNALRLMHDDEPRVRSASGDLIGALCQVKGPDVYLSCREAILKSVSDNLERKMPTDCAEYAETEALLHKFGPATPPEQMTTHPDALKIFHDTAGWKHLETSMRCLQAVIEGCGEAFNDHITQDLLDLIFQALNHANRFVRETGYHVCASLVRLGRHQDDTSVTNDHSEKENAVLKHGEQFAEYLKKGLADNWSQVRLAASVATRQFLQTVPNEDLRHRFYPELLPAMCLNRYYVAEGVRIYSQQSWKTIFGNEGKRLVEKFIKETVEFYISQTEADNHAVREAACACIAELATKVEHKSVSAYVAALLRALLFCFKDDSWPVRDAACVACGNFVLSFPEECRSSMADLYPLFFANLADSIPSVRQGGAIALANVVKAYAGDAIKRVFDQVKEGLQGVHKQDANTAKYSTVEKGPATFGVVKRLRDNDMELHTDKQMYSCGSLAPKMGRGGGCMDHKFQRPSEPWEKADGCVYLVAEISSNAAAQRDVLDVLPLMAEAAACKHYTQHLHFLETVCKQIPVIARGLGKRPFKAHLEHFLDVIFYSLTCENALTSSAAGDCLDRLGELLGPSILRGRVEMYNPGYLNLLDTPKAPGRPF